MAVPATVPNQRETQADAHVLDQDGGVLLAAVGVGAPTAHHCYGLDNSLLQLAVTRHTRHIVDGLALHFTLRFAAHCVTRNRGLASR